MADVAPTNGAPKEPTKAELAKAEFEAALAECTAGIEELMRKESLSSAEKYKLCRSIGEECIQDQELFGLLDKKPEIVGTSKHLCRIQPAGASRDRSVLFVSRPSSGRKNRTQWTIFLRGCPCWCRDTR